MKEEIDRFFQFNQRLIREYDVEIALFPGVLIGLLFLLFNRKVLKKRVNLFFFILIYLSSVILGIFSDVYFKYIDNNRSAVLSGLVFPIVFNTVVFFLFRLSGDNWFRAWKKDVWLNRKIDRGESNILDENF